MHLLNERQTADARPDDHAGTLAVLFAEVEPRVIHGHLGDRDGVLDERVGLLDLFLFDPGLGLEPAHFTGDPASKGCGIELGNGTDARAAFDEAVPGRLVPDAVRRDHSDPGDDDTALADGAVMYRGGGCVIPV